MLSIHEVDEPLGRVLSSTGSFQSVDIASPFNHGLESRPALNAASGANLGSDSFFQEVDLGNPCDLNREFVSAAGNSRNEREVEIELNTIGKCLDAIPS